MPSWQMPLRCEPGLVILVSGQILTQLLSLRVGRKQRPRAKSIGRPRLTPWRELMRNGSSTVGAIRTSRTRWQQPIRPHGLPSRWSLLLRDRGVAVQAAHLTFNRSGDVADLHGLVGQARARVRRTRRRGPNWPAAVHDLALALWERYERLGQVSDLDEAARLLREALTHPSGAKRPELLSMLGIVLSSLYRTTDSIQYLNEAIEVEREAGRTCRPGGPTALYASNLGLSYLQRYGETEELSDLEAAINEHRRAVANAGEKDYRRPVYLINLSVSLWTRASLPGESALLDDAISAAQQAVALTPVDHPDTGSVPGEPRGQPSRPLRHHTPGRRHRRCHQSVPGRS